MMMTATDDGIKYMSHDHGGGLSTNIMFIEDGLPSPTPFCRLDARQINAEPGLLVVINSMFP